MPVPGLNSAAIGAIGGARVSIIDASISDTTISPSNASASYRLSSAGAVDQLTASAGTGSLGSWISPLYAAGGNYEARVTMNSGSLTTGTTGTWLPLSSTRLWTLDRTTLGTATCTFTVEIRLAASGGVLDSAIITLSAEKTI